MAKLTTLKDKQGNILYPLTKTNAVSDSNGTSLDSLLSAINQNKQDKFTELLTDSNLWELTAGIYIATNDIFLRVKQAFYGVGLPSGTIMQVNGDINNQYGITATYVANNQVFVAQSYYTSENVIDGDFKILGVYDNTPTQNSTNPVTSGGVYNALAQHGKVKVYQNQPVGNLSKSVTIDASIKPTMIMFEAKTSGGNVVIKTMPYEVAKGWNYNLFMHDNRDCYLATSVFNLTESVSGNNKTITITYTQASQGGFTANSLGCWLVW